jgi:hypothetical protein
MKTQSKTYPKDIIGLHLISDTQAKEMIRFLEALGAKKCMRKYQETWGKYPDLVWGDYRKESYGLATSCYLFVGEDEDSGGLIYYFRNNSAYTFGDLYLDAHPFKEAARKLVYGDEPKTQPLYQDKQSAIDYLLKEHGIVVHVPFTIYDALSSAADNSVFITEEDALRLVKNALENSVSDVNDRIDALTLEMKQTKENEKNKQ